MKLHILGICGTFMGSIAVLAKEMGHEVCGSDSNVYPPMSTQLASRGIELKDGYLPSHLDPPPDLVLVGNTLSRGNPAVEYVLNQGLPYQSGPEWLRRHFLQERTVLAVAGTHGKTTTAGMLAWILEAAGLAPGFLIGGVAENFGISTRCGQPPWFVIEADEYDTAFFDKRAKFVHYRPATVIINNIEYDHADIFDDLAAIRREFHHMIRTVPSVGRIIRKVPDREIDRVLDRGCWTPCTTFGLEEGEWSAEALAPDYSAFRVHPPGGTPPVEVQWSLIGRHNAENALAAISAAVQAGVDAGMACEALGTFLSVKRRLQLLAVRQGVSVYDDFAHHPTAIAATLAALRAKAGPGSRIIAVLEPRSNSMRMGVHRDTLAASLDPADRILLFKPEGLAWDLRQSMAALGGKCHIHCDIEGIIEALLSMKKPGDHILVMSNGGFQGLHARLVAALEEEDR